MLKKLFFIAIIFLLAFGANTVNANETTTVLNETEDVSAYLDVIDINWSLFNPALEVHYWKAVEFYTDDKYKTVSNRLDAMLVIKVSHILKAP